MLTAIGNGLGKLYKIFAEPAPWILEEAHNFIDREGIGAAVEHLRGLSYRIRPSKAEASIILEDIEKRGYDSKFIMSTEMLNFDNIADSTKHRVNYSKHPEYKHNSIMYIKNTVVNRALRKAKYSTETEQEKDFGKFMDLPL